MTNEELVAAIRDGNDALIGELWEQVEKLVTKLAKSRLMSATTTVTEIDDLTQSGFFALLDAIRTYDAAEGCKFTTWLSAHLQNHFNTALNIRSEKQRKDPLHSADSLQRLISDDDEGATLGDLQPDIRAEAAFEAVEHRIWNEQLHTALDALLDDLPQNQREILTGRHYDAMSTEELSQKLDTTAAEIRSQENKGMRTLRKASWRLKPFIEAETNYYRHVGADEFTRTHTSAVESIAIWRESAQERAGIREKA